MNAHLYTTCMFGTHRVQKGALIGSQKTRVTATCEPSCGCWTSNLDPLEEQTLLAVCLLRRGLTL